MNKDYILHKWLNNAATEAEIEVLKNSPEYASYIKIAETVSNLETPINSSEAIFDAMKPQLAKKTKVKKMNPLSSFLKVAAVLAIVVTAYTYINSLNTSVQTNIAEKHTFLLPDNSEVALNANSSLEYNKNSWNEKRELTLKGEAYFKVTKGNSFKVKTPSGVITVLGTQFNVFARDNSLQVNCYEGLVSVEFNDTLIKLPAGTKLSLKNGVLANHQQFNKTSPTWIVSESSFDNASLQTVLNELGNQYPITITADIRNVNRRFTGSFTHKNLNLALKSICDPLQLTYSIRDESVSIYAKEGQ